MELKEKARLHAPGVERHLPEFKVSTDSVKASNKKQWLGQPISPVSPGSGFQLCNTAPTAPTRLSMFRDGYVAWRDVSCWTRGDRHAPVSA